MCRFAGGGLASAIAALIADLRRGMLIVYTTLTYIFAIGFLG